MSEVNNSLQPDTLPPVPAAALESRARIDGTDRGPNYSEQQMIDCVTEAAGYSSYGCAGGTAGMAQRAPVDGLHPG